MWWWLERDTRKEGCNVQGAKNGCKLQEANRCDARGYKKKRNRKVKRIAVNDEKEGRKERKKEERNEGEKQKIKAKKLLYFCFATKKKKRYLEQWIW